MSDRRAMLSAEERAEYDELMHEAGYDPRVGTLRPSGDIGARVVRLLEDAEQAGRRWASWVRVDHEEAGALAAFKRWNKVRCTVNTRVGAAVVKRSGVMAVRRRDEETGEKYWQGTFWPDMTLEDLLDVISASQVREKSEQITQADARRLIRLLHETGEVYVRDALRVRGVTLDEYLTAASL